MKKILCLLTACFCLALCSCSSGTVIIQEGKYCLSGSDAYIIVSNFDPDVEDSGDEDDENDEDDVEEEDFIGTCEVQFFNYDFSDLNDFYGTDTSEQFAENSCVFTYGSYEGEYWMSTYVTGSASEAYGFTMSLPVEYLPEENTLYIYVTEEKFILQTDD